jgi:hypothetical protein
MTPLDTMPAPVISGVTVTSRPGEFTLPVSAACDEVGTTPISASARAVKPKLEMARQGVTITSEHFINSSSWSQRGAGQQNHSRKNAFGARPGRQCSIWIIGSL